jgi:hypothetical protein
VQSLREVYEREEVRGRCLLAKGINDQRGIDARRED